MSENKKFEMSKSGMIITLVGALVVLLCFYFKQPGTLESVSKKPIVNVNDLSKVNHAAMSVPRRPPTDAVVQPLEVLPASNEPQLRGLPVKEYRHIAAKYFALSLGKDTPEGQTIASKLIQNNCGIEYASFVYGECRTLRQIKADVNNGLADKNVLEMKKLMAIEAFSTGANGLLPFPKPELLDELLELTPGKPYFPQGVEPISHAEGPESEWLSEKDVLKYIQEHPAS